MRESAVLNVRMTGCALGSFGWGGVANSAAHGLGDLIPPAAAPAPAGPPSPSESDFDVGILDLECQDASCSMGSVHGEGPPGS